MDSSYEFDWTQVFEECHPYAEPTFENEEEQWARCYVALRNVIEVTARNPRTTIEAANHFFAMARNATAT
jgi:hypothetical protein